MDPAEPERGGALDPSPAHRVRLAAAAARLAGAERVLDLGCGQGALTLQLARGGVSVTAVDSSLPSLQALERTLRREPEAVRSRVVLLHTSLEALDARLAGFDAAALVEVIEHVEPERLTPLERAVFHRLRPGRIVLTTPNIEVNGALGLPPGRLRHPDHRFEWPRDRFAAWAAGVATRARYAVAVDGIGPEFPGAGQPTHLAVFERLD